MRYRTLAAIAAAIVLASCAEVHPPFGPPGPNPHKTGIFVTAGEIVVDQDPIVIPRGDSAAIVWHLRTSGYRFADNGITIADAGDEFRCAREGEITFVCQNRHSKSGHFKYTIRLIADGKTLQLDPFIYNL
jgi:hypothetical protein